MRKARVAFSGASGTGKTTLARFLAIEASLPLNPVGSRSTASLMGFSSPYDVDSASEDAYYEATLAGKGPKEAAEIAMKAGVGDRSMRRAFQKRLLDEKLNWEVAHPLGYVTDRSAVDLWAYTALHDVYGLTVESTERVAAHCRGYDLILRTPLSRGQWGLGDEARRSEKAYHIAFESLLDGALLSWAECENMSNTRFISCRDIYWRKQMVLTHFRNAPRRD